MGYLEGLILKIIFSWAVWVFKNGQTTCPIAIQKVSTLNHEVLNDPVELAIFISLRSYSKFHLTCAKLPEILASLWNDIFKQFKVDPTGVQVSNLYIKKDNWILLVSKI